MDTARAALHSGTCRQYIAVSSVAFASLMVGSVYGWLTQILQKLTGPDSDVPMTEEQSSWVVSLTEVRSWWPIMATFFIFTSFNIVGDLLTPLPSGLLVDSWGRKPCMLFSAPFMILSWILVLNTRKVQVLYLVRILQGISSGILIVVAPTYVGEISAPRHRGSLSASLTVFFYTGVVLQYTIAPLVSYHTLALVSLAAPILFIVTFVFMPESPYFWLMKGNEEKALETLIWLRGATASLETMEVEMKAIKVSVVENIAQKSSNSWFDLVSTPVNRRCLLIVLAVSLLQILCGIGSIMTYVNTALSTSSEESWLKPEQYTMFFGFALLLSCILSSATVDHLGRRPLLLCSCLGVSICLFLVGTFFYVDSQTSIDISRYNWVVFIIITIYAVLFCCGMGALSPTIQGEFFPSNNRGLGNGVVIMICNCTAFIVLKVYYYIEVAVGTYLNFWLYATCGFLGFVFVYLYLPESKNKTLEEIQMEMKKTNACASNNEEQVV